MSKQLAVLHFLMYSMRTKEHTAFPTSSCFDFPLTSRAHFCLFEPLFAEKSIGLLFSFNLQAVCLLEQYRLLQYPVRVFLIC